MAILKHGEKVETPFTAAAKEQNDTFWSEYIKSRPSPSAQFFEIIRDYNLAHGSSEMKLAHDVGTGPGNIAERLLHYYEHVVASDVNANALAVIPALIKPQQVDRLTIVQTPAEGLGDDGIVPATIGAGQADLIVVSECIPLLDTGRALQAFHKLLKKDGTLAIYFYGRPIFVDGGPLSRRTPSELDDWYDKIATRICTFLLPFRGTPGFPTWARAAECLESWLDNIAFPADTWSDVVRYKWNSDISLLFNNKSGYDFDFDRVDRRSEVETTTEIHDRTWWQNEWDADQIKAYLDSVFPGYKKKAGERYCEIEEGIEELRQALGGGKAKVSFPVALVLATKN